MSNGLTTTTRPALASEFGAKYGVVGGDKVFAILKETVLKSKDPVSDAEVAAFIIVCNQYDLNPFTKEIYGFMSKGKMQYVLGVDGWLTLLNRQPNMDGMEFSEAFNDKGGLVSITCRIHRKDRSLPTVVTEYYNECKRDTDPWKQSPIRMLRHKAIIQCARIAFGLAGVMDEDEAERVEGFSSPIIDAQSTHDEVDALEKASGLAIAKLKTARANFSGRREEYIAYLKGVAPKATKQVSAGPQTIEAEPSEDDTTTEGTTNGSTHGGNSAATEPTEAMPADNKFDFGMGTQIETQPVAQTTTKKAPKVF